MKQHTHRILHQVSRTEGTTLIETLVSLAILVGLAVATMKMGQTMRGLIHHAKMGMETSNMKSVILEQASCSETLKSPCNGLVDLKARDGNVIIAATGTKAGPWTFRATCEMVDGRPNVSVQAALLRPGKPVTASDPNDFYDFPTRAAKADWTSREGMVVAPAFRFCAFTPDDAPTITPDFLGDQHASFPADCSEAGPKDSRTIYCAPNEVAIGGGHQCKRTTSGDAEVVTSMFTPNHTGWRGTCCDNAEKIHVFALCLKQ